MNIEIAIFEEGQSLRFQIAGEIDAFTAPKLKENFNQLASIENRKVAIDLEKVTYIDSTGLGIFIAFYKSLNEANSTMKITGLNERLMRLFEITGLDKVMDVEMKEGESQNESN